jgi:hypothetical protein
VNSDSSLQLQTCCMRGCAKGMLPSAQPQKSCCRRTLLHKLCWRGVLISCESSCCLQPSLQHALPALPPPPHIHLLAAAGMQ